MTINESIQYLQPIADSASLTRYAEALNMAISALREQEASQMALKAACSTLEQYINAEREGRMIVLPCKVGDIVYRAETEQVIPLYVVEHAVYLESAESGDFEVVSNFGKTVFLAREEAEQSLRRLEDV